MSTKHIAQSARTSAFRRRLAACCLTAVAAGSVTLSSGCSSMSGGSGWWSSTGGAMYGASTTAAKSVGGQFKSMGTTVSSAFGKTKSFVMSPFKSDATASTAADKEDPTSLANMPGKLTPELWVAQGHLAESQGQYPKALESYNKALQAEPNNVGALVSVARLHDRQGDSKQAVQYFQKAVAANPNDASIHNDLGLAYAKSGNAAAAKDSLGKASALEPSNVRFRNNLATVLVENGQAGEAVAQLKQVMKPAEAHYNVAYLHFTKQNIPAAQQELQNALQIDPNLQHARDLYARLSNSQTVAQAASAYQMAGSMYQAVQGMQPSGNVAVSTVSSPGFPTAPATAPRVNGTQLPDPNSLPGTLAPNWLNSPPVMSTSTP